MRKKESIFSFKWFSPFRKPFVQTWMQAFKPILKEHELESRCSMFFENFLAIWSRQDSDSKKKFMLIQWESPLQLGKI